jgi:hypothetical protein
MNPDREIDNVLGTWLTDGPTAAPDRVLDVLTDRIARQPQRPTWRLDWRPTRMTTTFKLGTAAVAVAIVAVLGYNLLPSSSPGTGGPSVPPSASPSPSPSLLAYTWPGALAAGTYATSFVWNAPISATFTVPNGWEGYDIEISKPGSHGLSVEFVLVENIFDDPCAPIPRDPPVGPTVDDLANAVAAMPGLDVVGPTPIAGSSRPKGPGAYLEYAMNQAAGCEPSTFVLWDLPAERFLTGVPTGGDRKDARARKGRIWILDVQGTRFVIRATWDPEASQAELDELQGIVDSISVGVARAPSSTQAPQPAP